MNPEAETSESTAPLPNSETANAKPPIKSRNRAGLDYWIAGLIILSIVGFVGRDFVSGIFGSSNATSEAARAAEQHIGTGMGFYNASDFRNAEAEFRKAVESDPNSALAYNDLGAVLNQQKRWAEAIAALRKALDLNPQLELAKNNLAYSYSQAQGNAVTSPQAAQAARVHIDTGMGCYNTSDFTAAEAEFRKAIQADPNSALAYNDLGAALNGQKRWDEAIPVFRKAIDLNPTLDLARNNLAYSLAQKVSGGNARK